MEITLKDLKKEMKEKSKGEEVVLNLKHGKKIKVTIKPFISFLDKMTIITTLVHFPDMDLREQRLYMYMQFQRLVIEEYTNIKLANDGDMYDLVQFYGIYDALYPHIKDDVEELITLLDFSLQDRDEREYYMNVKDAVIQGIEDGFENVFGFKDIKNDISELADELESMDKEKLTYFLEFVKNNEHKE